MSMRRIRVTATAANFNGGTLELSPEQYEPRKHALEVLSQEENPDGVVTSVHYRIVKTVQFKRGEELGYDGPINKLLADEVDNVDGAIEEEPPPPARKKKGK